MKPPSHLVEFHDWHAYRICHQMRDDEIVQFEAFVGAFDPEVAARGFINTPGLRFTLLDNNGEPVMAGGVFETGSGKWQTWMMATKTGWSTHWRSITKACVWMIDELFSQGARRIQTIALADRIEAIRWYEHGCGLLYEGTHKEYGNGGEDAVTYAISRSHYYGQ